MYNLKIIFIGLPSLFLISCEKKETCPIKIALIEPLSGPMQELGRILLMELYFLH